MNYKKLHACFNKMEFAFIVIELPSFYTVRACIYTKFLIFFLLIALKVA